MAKKKPTQNKKEEQQSLNLVSPFDALKSEVKRGIMSIFMMCISLIFFLSAFSLAGVGGRFLFRAFTKLFGVGYYLLPVAFVIIAIHLLRSRREKDPRYNFTIVGLLLSIFSLLGIIDLFSEMSGGYLGVLFGQVEKLFGIYAGFIILFGAFMSGVIVATEAQFNILNILKKLFNKKQKQVLNISNPDYKEGEKIVLKKETEEEVVEDKSPKIQKNSEVKILNGDEEKSKEVELLNKKKIENYKLPPLDLLENQTGKPTVGDVRANANIIKRCFENFGLEVEMCDVCIGPTVTQYTLKPAEGVKLSKIVNLHNDLALALAAHPIRIEAPIPGKSLVGIEVPNKAVATVRLRNLLATEEFQKSEENLLIPIGRNVANEPIYGNLARMPHILIAGATGTGKSVGIHSLIMSLLYRNSPDQLKFIMIDPKRVELSHYEGIPHLITPVITDNKKALPALRWTIATMEARLEELQLKKVFDIKGYNKVMKKSGLEPMPYIVIVIDELADLMMHYGRDLEAAIVRIAQLARAVGIHLVISTQRPSVEVITGLIKANITSRVSFQVASQIDSRTVLDTSGAEKLLGRGDLLFLTPDLGKPKRLQGAFVSDIEISGVIDFIKSQDLAMENALSFENQEENCNQTNGSMISFDQFDADEDEKFSEAVELVKQHQKASTSFLQRKLGLGYGRAAKIIDLMEERGIVGPANGSKPREVFLQGENPSEINNHILPEDYDETEDQI